MNPQAQIAEYLLISKIFTMSTKLDRLAIWLLNEFKDGVKRTRAKLEEDRNNTIMGVESGLSWDKLNARKKLIADCLGITFHDERHQGGKFYYYLHEEDCRKIDKVVGKVAVLNALAVEPILLDYQEILHRIMVDNIPSASKYLLDFFKAMKKNYVCEITYKDYDGKQQVAVIRPYFLRQTASRWYCVGYNEIKGGFRNYCLDRICEFERTNRTFKMKPGLTVEEFFKYSIGAFGGMTIDDAEEIEIKAFGKEVKYMSDCPWHHSQTLVGKNEEQKSAVFRFFLAPTYDFINKILEHSRTLVVVQPQSIRRTVAEAVKKIYFMYFDKGGNYIP